MADKENSIPLRPMSKSEIAERVGLSANHFWTRKVHADPDIMARLTAAGYKVKQRILTVRQVQIILDEFGLII